jgi:hypothetical protein
VKHAPFSLQTSFFKKRPRFRLQQNVEPPSQPLQFLRLLWIASTKPLYLSNPSFRLGLYYAFQGSFCQGFFVSFVKKIRVFSGGVEKEQFEIGDPRALSRRFLLGKKKPHASVGTAWFMTDKD